MSTYQLTLSPNYVPNWGSNEALRELFQNGIDRESETKGGSKFCVNYNPLARQLILSNVDTYLHKRTLLLGETTKDGKTTIGKYGEGYKLALLVLLRIGCRIVIENSHEIWVPHIVKSRTFQCDLIQIEVHKNKNSDGSLRYIIDGLMPEMYSDYQEKCLLFYPDTKVIYAGGGRILLDEKFAGKLFCNGLYVCTKEKLKYGYDIMPNRIDLNRDRNMVSEFNLSWETSRMWAEAPVKSSEVYTMIREGALDVEYLDSHRNPSSKLYKDLCEMHYQDFLKVHGINAVVVTSHGEAELIKSRYKNLVPVVVPTKEYHYIQNSESYRALEHDIREEFTPLNWIKEWLKNQQIDYFMIPNEKKEELLTEAEKWSY